jgi:hypothetical protein
MKNEVLVVQTVTADLQSVSATSSAVLWSLPRRWVSERALIQPQPAQPKAQESIAGWHEAKKRTSEQRFPERTLATLKRQRRIHIAVEEPWPLPSWTFVVLLLPPDFVSVRVQLELQWDERPAQAPDMGVAESGQLFQYWLLPTAEDQHACVISAELKHDAAECSEIERGGGRCRLDLDERSADLLAAIKDTIQPAHTSLWLRPGVGR